MDLYLWTQHIANIDNAENWDLLGIFNIGVVFRGQTPYESVLVIKSLKGINSLLPKLMEPFPDIQTDPEILSCLSLRP